MKRSALLFVLCSNALACVDTRQLTIPELEGPDSALVVIDTPPDRAVFGIERGDSQLALTGEEAPSAILFLSFPRSLASMGLERGLLVKKPEQIMRGLPTPIAARFGENKEGPVEVLEAIDVNTATELELFQSTEIPVPNPEQCARAYGCYADDADRLCLIPCEAAPYELSMPKPINLPKLECPWTVEVLAASAAAPELSELRGCRPIRKDSCTEGQWWHPGADQCEPVISACPSGVEPLWSSTTAPNQFYVHAEAAEGGDGSRGLPFQSIEDALERVPAGATLLLSASTFPRHSLIAKSINLLGACERTVLHGLTIDGGRTRVRDLVLVAGTDSALHVGEDAELI